MEEPAGARRLPHELSVVALVTAACVPLFRLFAGGLGAIVFLSISLSLTVSWLTRRYRFPALVAWLSSMAAMAWFLTVRFLPDTLWGPFPSLETIRAVGPMVSEGIRRTVQEVAPVTPSDSLLLFVAAGIWVTTWLAEAAAMWIGNPLLSVASTIPLFIVPGAIATSRRLWLDVGLWVAAAAWLIFDEERGRARAASTTNRPAGWRAAPAARLALLAAIVAAAAAPLMPGYGGEPGFGSGAGSGRVSFNPLVAIQPTLNRAPERNLFLVRTPLPTYMRLTALDVFDGRVWRASSNRSTTHIEGLRVEAATPFAPAQLIQQRVRIQALAGPWLPAAYDPVEFRSQSEAVAVASPRLEDVSRALILAAGSVEAGFEYEVQSAVPTVSAAELQLAQVPDPEGMRPYLALPRIPREVGELARRVAGSEPDNFSKAIALQDHLRTFTYDLDVAAGHGYDSLVEFLTESKRGYCEQFSAAMAVMARSLGIPARVAIGFGFGDLVAPDVYEITTTEAHAWTEIFFPSYGWLAFEPTPRSGIARVPAYARAQATTAPSASPSPSPTASANPTDDPTTNPRTNRPDPADEGGGATGRRAGWVMPVVVIAIVVVVIGAAAGVLTVRRRRRWTHKPPREAVSARYVDFLRWCASAGYPRGMGETPSEHAARVGVAVEQARPALETLARMADEALWAPPNGLAEDDFVRADAAARAAISDGLSRRSRAAAVAGWGRWRAPE